MQWLRFTRLSLAIVGAVCATGLLAAVPAAHATVGGVCKLNTPENPHMIWQNGARYIESNAVMWCERDAWVIEAQALFSNGVFGQRYTFIARAGQRYVLSVKFQCKFGMDYTLRAKAEFSGPEGYVYNTSGWVTIACR